MNNIHRHNCQLHWKSLEVDVTVSSDVCGIIYVLFVYLFNLFEMGTEQEDNTSGSTLYRK